jgi:signal transduction histidine kinase
MRLTETFKQLTHGSGNAKIFSYPVADEISELSQAAAAFRDKNTQTEKLLARSIQLTQALEKNRIALERSNDELEQFVYTVSHDLKAPLVTSMGFIGIIRKLADQGKYEQAIEKLDKVTLSIERMGQLTNDLLELSRIGRIDVDMEKIDLNVLLKQLAQSQQVQLQSAGLQFVIQPGLPGIVGNESRILQLFENILTNAMKYVRNPEQAPMLEIGSVIDQNSHLIYCKDNGPGIELAFQQKVFALFYRLDTQPEGTGIGLAIAKKVMKSHGGDIWIESSGGKGTIFWLKFPIAVKEEKEVEHGV